LPQAHGALVAGRWERARWEGVELHGKTLGIIGLGRVGALVAARAAAFGMELIAYDPFITPERARQMGVSLLGLVEVIEQADFLTVHLPKTAETAGLIDAALLAHARPHLRIINTSRGGIVDESALAAAVTSGQIAGAALDVFATEPTTESPLFGLDPVVVTPHLGASTREAQDKAGLAIAAQVVAALAGEFVPFGVNLGAPDAPEAVRAWVPLAERLGRVWALLSRELPPVLSVAYQGGLADHDTRLLTLSVQKGVWSVLLDEPVSLVNAGALSAERGLSVEATAVSGPHDYVNLVELRGGGRSVAGTLFGGSAEQRIVMVDDHDLELPIAPSMLVVRNDDRIGLVAAVAGVLAGAELNIADLKLGRTGDGRTAMMALSFEQPVPASVVS
ncbi:MAG: NAD(P)-dependent oxidoreductase, partial [Actinomycetes bacterium]